MRCECGPDEGAGAGDRGEVVSEDDPLVGGDVVASVVESNGGGGALVVELEDVAGDDPAVYAVGYVVGADGGGEEPCCIDRLTAFEGEPCEACRSEEGDEYEKQRSENPAHSVKREGGR